MPLPKLAPTERTRTWGTTQFHCESDVVARCDRFCLGLTLQRERREAPMVNSEATSKSPTQAKEAWMGHPTRPTNPCLTGLRRKDRRPG